MYLYLNPTALKIRLRRAKRALQGYEFDTIAFRGMSGAFAGPALAMALKKQMILVRKPADDSHSILPIEGYKHVSKYIIVDDFISTGTTRTKIIEAVQKFNPDASYVGFLEINKLYKSKLDALEEGELYPLR